MKTSTIIALALSVGLLAIGLNRCGTSHAEDLPPAFSNDSESMSKDVFAEPNEYGNVPLYIIESGLTGLRYSTFLYEVSPAGTLHFKDRQGKIIVLSPPFAIKQSQSNEYARRMWLEKVGNPRP